MEDHVLIRYLKHQVTDDEAKAVEQWIGSSSNNNLYFINLKVLWEKTTNIPEISNPDIGNAWMSLNHKINSLTIRTNLYYFGKIAALLIVAIVISKLLWDKLPNFHSVNYITVVSDDSIRKVVLSDNSTIWLNSNSSIKYDNSYNKKNRNIALTGEAFFDVRHNIKMPFVIQTKFSTIRDLGTSFNVKTSKKSGEVTVTVVTGKICLSDVTNQSNTVNVTPNFKAILTPGTAIKVKSLASINESAWFTKRLSFHNQSWQEIAVVLEEYYKIKIVFTNPEIKSKRISAAFDHQSIRDVLVVLCNTSNDKFKFTNGTAILYK